MNVRTELDPISPFRHTFCYLLSPLPAEKALNQSKGRTRKEGYADGKGVRDYAKTAGRSVNKQKTSKTNLMATASRRVRRTLYREGSV